MQVQTIYLESKVLSIMEAMKVDHKGIKWLETRQVVCGFVCGFISKTGKRLLKSETTF